MKKVMAIALSLTTVSLVIFFLINFTQNQYPIEGNSQQMDSTQVGDSTQKKSEKAEDYNFRESQKINEDNDNLNQSDFGSDNNRCIIIIDQNKYDVSNLKYTHTGGNIFKCGQDMTKEFEQKHRLNLKMIEKYKVK
ncbi:hypothetical protein D6810_01680 [Candidatus Dojkabacteria bacterium]|uniref:Cytochrome b5 heme-binding domain-containing protein n=1 Tax=Candidatus Dojkabacteria bacterium TaxID=2099670 RepID=A0A3M0Z2K2_9BACT|nr:MAG: hypothetical protein D6810_01680 [Candidatus Dojkabacteria bacterium]